MNLLPINKKFVLTTLVLILLIALAAGGIYQKTHKKNSTNTTNGYVYNQLENYHWQCGPKCGISFSKPREFKAEQLTDQVVAAQFSAARPDLSVNKIAIKHTAAADTKSQNLDLSALQASDPVYIKIVQPFKDYISQNLPPNYKVTATALEKTTLGPMKTGAWSINYTAASQPAQTPTTSPYETPIEKGPAALPAPHTTPPAPASKQTKQPAQNLNPLVKGRALIILQNNNIFYIVINLTQANWESNTIAEQTIFNSLKIDQ